MLGGGGADGAIHRAAGPELRTACFEVPEVRPGVRCPVGEAKITRGFKLPASHVIHTVGPVYDKSSNVAALLSNAYRNSLRVARENNIHMKSILTQSALDALCEKFHIPDIVHPELPEPNDRIRNSPTGKIGVYSRFFDFANYRIPLSQFLIDILGYFQINLSQLSVIAAANISHFEILCRVYGFVLTVVDASVFPLAVSWHNNKTLRKDPHPTPDEFDGNVCDYLADNPAPMMRMRVGVLCLRLLVCSFLRVSDLFLLYAEMDLFASIYHADPTKVRIEKIEVREGEVPMLELTRGRVVLLAGVNDQGGADVQGVVNEEGGDVALLLLKGQSSEKRRKSNGASGSNHPPKKLRADHGTSGDAGASTGGKSLAAIQELFEQSTLNVEVGIKAAATVPFVTSSVTPMPEREEGGRTDSVTGPNLRTQRAGERFVVLSDSSHHSSTNVVDDEVTSIVRSSMTPPHVLTMAVYNIITADATFAPLPRVGTKLVPHSIFRYSASTNKANQDVAGPSHHAGTKLSTDSFFVSPDLRSMDYEQLFVEFNVGAARQTCLSSEIANVEAAEAARVNELNGLKERTAALDGHVAALESAATSKDTELASSNAQVAKMTLDLSNLQFSCDELSIKAAFLESVKDKLIDQVSTLEGACFGLHDEVMGYKLFKDQIEAVQDEQVKVLSDKVVGLDANLMGMALHLDEEFYPRHLTTIAGRRWIFSHHKKALWGLAKVAAYNPTAEANYVAVVNAFRVVDFPLIAQLASHKDASVSDLMDLLRLEGHVAETLKASQLQPSPDQLMLPIYRDLKEMLRPDSYLFDALVPLIEPLSAENLVGEASTSGVPVTATTTSLSTTFIQASTVPPVPVTDHEVSSAGSSTKVPYPSKIVFENEELETTSEHTTAS
uniref:Appr-1-p processing n=1 Tax=Tanacetum cinerariifolium TaxID=118510 RepID=A0A6L2L1R2_TANCI|nr:appr-1-p processing [Tanacetum cinerariifolium]